MQMAWRIVHCRPGCSLPSDYIGDGPRKAAIMYLDFSIAGRLHELDV